MGILGLTHDENGAALEKLPVTIKVAIGEGPTPDDENGSPRALFHFVFKRRTMRGQSVCWEPAPDIAQVFGDKPTELAVIFLHDDPREVCPSEYALWTRKGRLCHGELVQISNGNAPRYEMQAIRRTAQHPEGESWPGNHKYADGPKEGQPIEGCGEGCPELESGKCGPSADLYFILEKFPSLGAICRLHREQDVSSQFVERRGSTSQLEWGPIEVGQSRSQSHAPASLASRAIRRVGKFRCPHSEP